MTEDSTTATQSFSLVTRNSLAKALLLTLAAVSQLAQLAVQNSSQTGSSKYRWSVGVCLHHQNRSFGPPVGGVFSPGPQRGILQRAHQNQSENRVQRRFTVAPAKTLTLGTTEASNGSEYIFRGGQSAENLQSSKSTALKDLSSKSLNNHLRNLLK